jgi:hypothetical protein
MQLDLRANVQLNSEAVAFTRGQAQAGRQDSRCAGRARDHFRP